MLCRVSPLDPVKRQFKEEARLRKIVAFSKALLFPERD